jgi:hypothetical protein
MEKTFAKHYYDDQADALSAAKAKADRRSILKSKGDALNS